MTGRGDSQLGRLGATLIGAGALWAALVAPAQARLDPGDIVVADTGADAILKVDPATGSVSMLADEVTLPNGAPAEFVTPSGVAIDPRIGLVVVADQDANPAGYPGNTGTVFVFSPATLEATAYAADEYVAPSGVALRAQGNYLNVVVADRDADPAELGGDTGAIFRFLLGGAQWGVLATSEEFIAPSGVALDARGNVVVADQSADPAGLGGFPGAIFRFAPGQPPAALATSAQFEDPASVAVDAQGKLVVADFDADPAGLGGDTGAIFRFAPGQPPGVLGSSARFRDPFGVAIDARGRVVVADEGADPAGLGGDTGAIFRLAPGQPAAALATSTQLVDPVGVAIISPKCLSLFATIVGDGRPNVMRGTPGIDVIWGGGRRDRLSGAGGYDWICGESGNDRLAGGRGPDRLSGGKGKDRLSGGKRRDVLKGGKGSDRLIGGRGDDVLVGGGGNDSVNARDGHPDSVNCGSGLRDRVRADRQDRIQNCEVIRHAS